MNEGSPSKGYGMIMNPWCPTIHSNEASASELIYVQKDLLAPITVGAISIAGAHEILHIFSYKYFASQMR
jgi:hypothetical protein